MFRLIAKMRKPGSGILAALIVSSAGLPAAEAVVGHAERYDELEEQRLKDFHGENILDPAAQERKDTLETMETIKFPATEHEQAHDEELERLKKELLRIPERDRIKFGIDGQHLFESNIKRRQLGQEQSDSVFDVNSFVEFDLGGRKTDLRFEIRGGKQWNIQFSENDFWTVEERLRYRRKYFRKITHSVQSRIARHSQKTVEINEKKVRWDSHQNSIINYAFSRRASFNLELNARKRLFTAEAFDQDSQWQVSAAPSAFWHITPKSRVALTYTFGASRIRSKSSDANSHDIHLAYFGRLTRKSSLSFDISFSHQTPRSNETPEINTARFGIGYILQLTPKTQVTVQAIRQLQDTTSDLVSGTENETIKEDSYFTNDSLSVSLNSRLNSKLSAIFTTGITHLRTKVEKGGDEDRESRQFTFPTSLTFNYMLKRWAQLRLRYTFAYRRANAAEEQYRTHSLMSGLNLQF